MNGSDALKALLERVPFSGIALLAAAYFLYDYYSFHHLEDSPLFQQRQQLEAMVRQKEETERKLKKAKDFWNNLEAKRSQLRSMAQKLDEMKTRITEELDAASFIKMVVTEARKVGLTVVSIKPTELKTHEYYEEQAFGLVFKGVYVQLLVFFDRLSKLERIIRVDDFEIKRSGLSASTFVPLSGTIQIKTYRYRGSKADELAKSGGSVGAQTGGTAPGASAEQAPSPDGGSP